MSMKRPTKSDPKSKIILKQVFLYGMLYAVWVLQDGDFEKVLSWKPSISCSDEERDLLADAPKLDVDFFSSFLRGE